MMASFYLLLDKLFNLFNNFKLIQSVAICSQTNFKTWYLIYACYFASAYIFANDDDKFSKKYIIDRNNICLKMLATPIYFVLRDFFNF